MLVNCPVVLYWVSSKHGGRDIRSTDDGLKVNINRVQNCEIV